MDTITKDWFNSLAEEGQRGHINMMSEIIDFDQKACNKAFANGWYHVGDALLKSVNFSILQKNQFTRLFNKNKA